MMTRLTMKNTIAKLKAICKPTPEQTAELARLIAEVNRLEGR